MQSTKGFSSMLDGSWGYDKKSNHTTQKVVGKKESFTEELAIRLQNCQIECTDALYIIRSRDTPDSFFYCDPPYINSDCGNYDAYTEQDYENLLKLLSTISGKFLLSSYSSTLLNEYIRGNRSEERRVGKEFVSRCNTG